MIYRQFCQSCKIFLKANLCIDIILICEVIVLTNKIGFDNEMYIREQSRCIRERVDKFGGKLYLEFGGKLFDDFHAARVLPGFDLNGKVKLLSELKEQAEIIFCISAGAIEKNKIRADIGITYDMDVLRLIDNLRNMGLYIGSILITQYKGQNAADIFKKKLETLLFIVYTQLCCDIRAMKREVAARRGRFSVERMSS